MTATNIVAGELAAGVSMDRTLIVLAAALGAALNVINDAIESGDLPTITAGEVAAVQNTTGGALVLDKSGLPWDERIHAATKTQTNDGIWTKRKKLGEGVFEAVVAVLRQTYPAAAATISAPVATAPVATAPVATAPVVAAAPSISVPVTHPPVVVNKTSYQKLVDFLALNTGADKSLTSEWANEQFATNNITLASLASPEHDATAQQFLEAFRGVLASMNIAEVIG